MKIRDLNIDAYDWNVRVYFAVTCYHTDSIIKSLNDIQCPAELMDHIRDNLLKCDMDTGFQQKAQAHGDDRGAGVIASRVPELF